MSYVYGIVRAIATTVEALTPDETSVTDSTVRLDYPDAFRWCVEDDPPEGPEDAGSYDDRTFWLAAETQRSQMDVGTSTTALVGLEMTLTVVYAAANDLRPIVQGIAWDDAARLCARLFVAQAERLISWPSGVSPYSLVPGEPRLVTQRGENGMLMQIPLTVRYQRTIS